MRSDAPGDMSQGGGQGDGGWVIMDSAVKAVGGRVGAIRRRDGASARCRKTSKQRSRPGSAEQNSAEPGIPPGRGRSRQRQGVGRHISEKKPLTIVSSLFSGDGRTRTAVQTTHQSAFYTLILPLVVGGSLPEGGRTDAYPLSLGGV